MIRAEQQRKYELEIEALVRTWPGAWNEIRVHACANVHAFGLTISADIRLPRGPRGISALFGQLRELMADPQRGAWLMADIYVPRVGEATFSYDWMTKPDWPGTGGSFSDHDDHCYLEDLAKFPRTPENIPDWYPSAENVSPVPDYVDPEAERSPAPLPRRGDTPEVALTGLSFPFGVAVDNFGTLYVTDTGNDRVVALPPGDQQPIVLPFNGLSEPCGIAVDTAGTVYVADSLHDRILALPVGGTSATELPLPGLKYPGGVAVDSEGTLYITDRVRRQVMQLRAGASEPTILPFSGIRDPKDVAIDHAGAVYVTDGTMHNSDEPSSGRVLKLDGGTGRTTELLTGLRSPFGITIDTAGDLYLTTELKDGEVCKFPIEPPHGLVAVLTGLHKPAGLAVGADGILYVAEMPPGADRQSCGRIVKLAGRGPLPAH